ncbi:MAG TPA: hypothetical protein DHV48_07715 [Prolixibacteraceae bacterium]|nr:hypothetical protein [Prolixibacteraceae bacterium]
MSLANITKESSIENPFGFFEYFFLGGGFQKFHKYFFTVINEEKGEFYEDQLGPDFVEAVNLGEEYIVINHISTDEDRNVTEKRVYFIDRLKSHLKEQRDNSKIQISKKIASFDLDEGKTMFYLKNIVNELVYLIDKVKLQNSITQYNINLLSLYLLIGFMHKRYNGILSYNEFPKLKEAEQFFKKEFLEVDNTKQKESFSNNSKVQDKVPSDIKALNWIKSPLLNSITLHGILSENKIIDEDGDTLERIKQAFSGEVLNSSLNIKWSLTKNNSIKPPLVRIFKHLLMDELKVIEKMEDADLARSLSNIFVDQEGKPAKNMFQPLSKSGSVSAKTSGVNTKSDGLDETELINIIRSTPFLK